MLFYRTARRGSSQKLAEPGRGRCFFLVMSVASVVQSGRVSRARPEEECCGSGRIGRLLARPSTAQAVPPLGGAGGQRGRGRGRQQWAPAAAYHAFGTLTRVLRFAALELGADAWTVHRRAAPGAFPGPTSNKHLSSVKVFRVESCRARQRRPAAYSVADALCSPAATGAATNWPAARTRSSPALFLQRPPSGQRALARHAGTLPLCHSPLPGPSAISQSWIGLWNGRPWHDARLPPALRHRLRAHTDTDSQHTDTARSLPPLTLTLPASDRSGQPCFQRRLDVRRGPGFRCLAPDRHDKTVLCSALPSPIARFLSKGLAAARLPCSVPVCHASCLAARFI